MPITSQLAPTPASHPSLFSYNLVNPAIYNWNFTESTATSATSATFSLSFASRSQLTNFAVGGNPLQQVQQVQHSLSRSSIQRNCSQAAVRTVRSVRLLSEPSSQAYSSKKVISKTHCKNCKKCKIDLNVRLSSNILLKLAVHQQTATYEILSANLSP